VGRIQGSALNAAKHGVTFEEARDVFDDPRAVEFFDAQHSEEEPRYARIGLSGKRLLFVVFTDRDDRKRIIHARKASQTMELEYVESNK
jgi:uncharacterized DUF497 family protein